MTIPFRKTVLMLALAAFSTLALADTPARVGRIALAQGPVNISADVGEEAAPALVNWPVTSSNQIVTQRNGRTEIRVGSTSVRLDGDSSLDVIELDDEKLRLHLHYGSLNLRVRNPDVLRGLEISTPQGLVRMKEVGRLRIDAERVRDTTNVSVFEGAAQVDGGGSTLSVRAGKRVDVHEDDVRTALAVRDSFDDWSLQRDARDERTTSDRYVTSEMTGYEELDQHGVWRDDSEYGPLWTPRTVAADWVPYRDGRWTYLAPWGWTWVDNAPWGYAPSHYGRWVMVRQRWSWAPGRNIGRPVWAPALVGWVGGNNWNLAFHDNGTRRNAPAQGWYPLNPGESYVPGYHLPPEHLRHHNRHARPDYRPGRHDGLTVVNLNLFNGRNQIVVPRAPRPVFTQLPTQNLPVAAPPRPQGNWPNRFDRDGDGRPDRGPDRVLTSPTTGSQTVVPFSRRDGRLSDNERLVRTPPQVLTVTDPQRSLAEKDRRQREAEIERRERDQANERRLREMEADVRRTTDTQQRMREAEIAERRREAEADRQRGVLGERVRAVENERRQREAEAQLQAQRDAANRQQAERQQRDANNRQLADRLQRDADQERLRQLERQQQTDRQQAERQQRDAENARRQQEERQKQDAENSRRQQAERQQAERQQRDAENERRQQAERQQRDAQQREAQQREAQQREAAQAQARQAQQAQQEQQKQQKQAEEADKRERAREQRQDRRDNVQQQIR